MFPALPSAAEGDQPRIPASRDETLERIGHDLLLSQDSCRLLRLACQIADYDAATAEREAGPLLTNERAPGPSASAASETLRG
jgi:hypothetical protein